MYLHAQTAVEQLSKLTQSLGPNGLPNSYLRQQQQHQQQRQLQQLPHYTIFTKCEIRNVRRGEGALQVQRATTEAIDTDTITVTATDTAIDTFDCQKILTCSA